MNDFDTIIIGGGIGGLMTAYTLISKIPKHRIAIIEKGKEIEKRSCPASKDKCVHCKVCSITSGMSGAGAFSDGKLNLGTAYGGSLGEELGENIAMNYINKVDNILKNFSDGDYPCVYSSNEDLKNLCLRNDLQLLDMNVRHLGTERNFAIMKRLITYLKEKNVEIITEENVLNITPYESKTSLKRKVFNWVIQCKNNNYLTNNVVIATGRTGADFVQKICSSLEIPVSSNTVDIGVRVEMKDSIWKHFSQKIYEPKILCRTKTFEDRTRSFCFNQGGIVSAEGTDGIITANGHSYADKRLKTENCNFAILSSINFTEPFNKPTEYCKKIAFLSNAIGNGNVIVQRYGDLIRGRRTNEHRLARNSVIPTLKATPGDLSLVLPHRVMTNIIETIQALNKIASGTSNDDTLLYGVEAKYYSVKPKTGIDFSITKGIYICGDCSGRCRGLSQSGAMGIYIAEKIVDKVSRKKKGRNKNGRNKFVGKTK